MCRVICNNNCDAVTTKGNENHTGGTATCTAKAECSVCGTSYGNTPDHSYGEDNKCVCGAELTVEPEASSGLSEEIIIAIAVAAIALIGGIVAIIIIKK